MRIFILAALISGFALLAIPADARNEHRQIRRGEEIFRQSCQACHAENLQGTAPFGPFLWSGTAGGNDEAIRAIIAFGSARMPGWRYRYNEKDIRAISAYLLSIKRQPQVSKQDAAAAYGISSEK